MHRLHHVMADIGQLVRCGRPPLESTVADAAHEISEHLYLCVSALTSFISAVRLVTYASARESEARSKIWIDGLPERTEIQEWEMFREWCEAGITKGIFAAHGIKHALWLLQRAQQNEATRAALSVDAELLQAQVERLNALFPSLEAARDLAAHPFDMMSTADDRRANRAAGEHQVQGVIDQRRGKVTVHRGYVDGNTLLGTYRKQYVSFTVSPNEEKKLTEITESIFGLYLQAAKNGYQQRSGR